MGCIFIFEKTMLIESRPVFQEKTSAVLPAVVAHDGSCRSTRKRLAFRAACMACGSAAAEAERDLVTDSEVSRLFRGRKRSVTSDS
jgi:hypothetical protein